MDKKEKKKDDPTFKGLLEAREFFVKNFKNKEELYAEKLDKPPKDKEEAKRISLILMCRDLFEEGILIFKESETEVVYVKDFTPVPFAKRLMKDDKYLLDENNTLWRFNKKEGIWIDDAELYIKSRLRKQLMVDEQQKKYYVSEIIEYLKGICWNNVNVTDPPKNIIPFQNVLYDIDKDDFLDFDPKYFITSKIPVEINSMYKDCDLIDIFLEELVGKDKRKVLYELMAYCLYRSYPYQKFFILYGDGNNGKSAFLRLLIKLLGIDNISSEKPQALIANRFSAANLHNKLANISPDIPYTELGDSSVMRELTGEDSLTCERKYKDSFKFFNFAKIILSANELPQVKDRTYAFDRRIYIVIFKNKIKNPDPEIVDKITKPSQINGLGWQLIKILKEMKKRGFRFSDDPPVEEMSELYEDLSNSLVKFLKEYTEIESSNKLADWELKQKFGDWCASKGLRIWRVGEVNDYMKQKFGQGRMNQELYDKEMGKFNTKFVKAWEGLGWKD